MSQGKHVNWRQNRKVSRNDAERDKAAKYRDSSKV